MTTRNYKPVFVVNVENSGVDAKDYHKFEPVFVVNSGNSGTTVDTFTKTEINDMLKPILESLDALASAKKDGTSSLSIETSGWIEQNVFLIKKKIERCEQMHEEYKKILEEFVQDYDDFRSYILEMLNVKQCEEDMQQEESKKPKTDQDVELEEKKVVLYDSDIPVIETSAE